MDGIIIRKAVREDCAQLVAFIQKEGSTTSENIDLKDFETNGFDDDQPPFCCMVAVSENNVICGCAIWSVGYGTWKARKMYIEELCISRELKGTQFEEKFISRLCQEALTIGCSEIKTCTELNSHLAQFMLKFGAMNATQVEEWHLFSIPIKKEKYC